MIDQLEKEIHEGMLDLYQHQSMSRERESLVYFYFAGIHNENITLKEEIERLKEQLNEIDDELKQSEIMVKQQNEIERLKDLCNKYEKEHKTTYEIWKKDIYLYHSMVDRIDKAIEYIEEQSKFIEGCDIYRICNKDVLLSILKGVDKE